jgi:endonuclease YncB( thermonuclease family)
MSTGIDKWDAETAARRMRYRIRLRFTAGVMIVCAVVSILLDHRYGNHSSGDDWARFDGRQVRIVRVIDGESLAVQEEASEAIATIRLLGIKPFNQPWDKKWADEANAQLGGERITLHLGSHQTRDDHGRLLVDATLADGSAVSEKLAAEGLSLADHESKSAFTAAVEKAQSQARRKQIGMWQEEQDSVRK